MPIPLQVDSYFNFQNSHTQANRHHTATKKPSQTFHPTPVFSAILSILRMVPFNLTLVLSKLSFILSASAEESRISSPMATVSCLSWLTLEERMLVFSFSFCDSRDSRTEWEYWPLRWRRCQRLNAAVELPCYLQRRFHSTRDAKSSESTYLELGVAGLKPPLPVWAPPSMYGFAADCPPYP
jgi:hypothetical protein